MMGNKRIDESLPPYEIIRDKDGNPVPKDGYIQRNDGELLTPAEKNPWYQLATIAGKESNPEINRKNARIWNGFWHDFLAPEIREEIKNKLTDEQRESFAPLNERVVAGIKEEICDLKLKISSQKEIHMKFSINQREYPLIHLDHIYCKNNLSMDGFIFPVPCFFDYSHFEYLIDFKNCLFEDRFSFQNAYARYVTLNGNIVKGKFSASFSKSTLHSFDFEDNEIKTDITFEESVIKYSHIRSTFYGKAIFKNTKFTEKSDISSEFRSSVDFSHAEFNANANYNKCLFESEITFDAANFNGKTTFTETSFNNEVTFNNTTFKNTTDFTNASFKKYVPKFFDAQLHQETYFTVEHNFWDYWKNKFKKYHNMEISSQKWPTPPMEIEISKDIKEVTAKNRLAYGRLRQIMNGWQRPREELFFYRQEMYCEAALEAVYYKRPSWTFGVLSDYGFSVWRPLALITAFWLIGWLLVSIPYFWITPSPQAQISRITTLPIEGSKAERFLGLSPALIATMPQGSTPPSCKFTIDDGAVISLSNMLPYLGISNNLYPDLSKCMGPWLKFTSLAQGIGSTILLFLLALGLRNRFRLK